MPATDPTATATVATVSDWRRQRRSGLGAIALSLIVTAAIWLAIRSYAPPITGMETIEARLLYAFKCWLVAVLLCFATGIDAVAHERLQSAAFDPLLGHETRRLRVNYRYLQNTLEQLVLFAAALFGLALYSPGSDAMRAVEATAVTWIASRFAFWLGYHRSAAMRGLGAAGLALVLGLLVYVACLAARDLWGTSAMWGLLATFLVIEALLFWFTRARD